MYTSPETRLIKIYSIWILAEPVQEYHSSSFLPFAMLPSRGCRGARTTQLSIEPSLNTRMVKRRQFYIQYRTKLRSKSGRKCYDHDLRILKKSTFVVDSTIISADVVYPCTLNIGRCDRRVMIKEDIEILTIPSREEDESELNTLYWSRSDYIQFRESATEEMRLAKLNNPNLSPKEIIVLLYQPTEEDRAPLVTKRPSPPLFKFKLSTETLVSSPSDRSLSDSSSQLRDPKSPRQVKEACKLSPVEVKTFKKLLSFKYFRQNLSHIFSNSSQRAVSALSCP